MQLDQKKKKKKEAFAYFSTHSEYASYNASECLDTCERRKRFDPTRVNAPKISGSLTSGYLDTCKRSLNFRRRPILCTTLYRNLMQASNFGTAHLTNFSFEFFYALFTEDAPALYFVYTMVQKVKNDQKLKSRGVP